jgi:hypothetical protein
LAECVSILSDFLSVPSVKSHVGFILRFSYFILFRKPVDTELTQTESKPSFGLLKRITGYSRVVAKPGDAIEGQSWMAWILLLRAKNLGWLEASS